MAIILEILIVLIMTIFTANNLASGVGLFLMVRILVPEDVRIPFANISLNTAMIIILFGMTVLRCLFHGEGLRKNRKFIICLLGFCIYCMISLLLSDYGDLFAQTKNFIQFFVTDLLPCVLAVSILKNEKDVMLVIKMFLIACIITTVYGIVSYVLQSNPYRMLWSDIGEAANKTHWYGEYTTSTFVSTNSLGYFIGLSLPFVAFLLHKGIYKDYSKIVIVLMVVCSLLAKKRTTVVVLLCYAFMWLISEKSKKKIRYLVYSIPVACIALILIFTVPRFESIKKVIITSVLFWDDTVYNSVVMGNGGSDWTLRVRQFTYPFIEVKDNPVFGHGFGWCSWYLSQGTIHPVLYGFETLVAQGICEFGLASFILFPFVFYFLYRFACIKTKDRYVLLFVVTSIIQMLGTGAVYWYLELLLIVLMRLVNEQTISEKDAVSNNNYACV